MQNAVLLIAFFYVCFLLRLDILLNYNYTIHKFFEFISIIMYNVSYKTKVYVMLIAILSIMRKE